MIGVVCALAAEARPLARLAGASVSVSGMGGDAAAAAARALIDSGATALLSWGLAGALDPALAAGALFLPSCVMASGGAALDMAPAWHQRLRAALADQHPIARGTLLTSARALGSAAAKAAAFRDTGALAVEQVAAAHGLPFVAIKVIVDRAADDLPRAVAAAADAAGRLHLWRLLGALARSPADLAPLSRLALRYRAASRTLAAAARLGSLAPA
jgi:nucleoside phosphorylase